MDDLFAFRNGQDCEIFKAARFEQGDDIIYIPDVALNLIDVALLRARAAAAGITEISQKDTSVMIFMAVLDFAAVSACCAAPDFKGRIFFAAGKQPQLTVKLAKGEDALKAAQKLVGNYAVARSSSTESGNP